MPHPANNLNKIFTLAVFAGAAAFFYALLFALDVKTDIQKHIEVVWMILHGKDFPPNFLYFLAVAAAAFFQDNQTALLAASLLVLSLATAYKFQITTRLFSGQIESLVDWSQNKIVVVSSIVGFCLITALCIYLPKELGLTDYFLLGQIPPNVWHNSTTIFLMPFALLLFWHSYLLLEEFAMKRLWLVIGLVTLNILVKPSFFLCFGAVFPLVALIRFRLKREFFLCLIPIFWGFAFVVLEYIAIYKLGSYGTSGESGIVFAPFVWWRIYAPNIPVSILLSTAFPLAYLIFYYKKIVTEPVLYYAYLLFVVGLAFLAFINESGSRETHGNFQWQAIISNYILFFAIALEFSKDVAGKKHFAFKDKIIAAVFFLHVFSGWLYLAKTLLRGNYG